ncbi:hypothetical protein ABK040_006762 [Willaertia magna]
MSSQNSSQSNDITRNNDEEKSKRIDKLLKETQKSNKIFDNKEDNMVYQMERTVFENRLNSPIAFNVLMFNLAVASAYLSGRYRRRIPPQLAKANTFTITSTLLLCGCYFRSLSPTFEKKYALPPRREKLSDSGYKRWLERVERKKLYLEGK